MMPAVFGVFQSISIHLPRASRRISSTNVRRSIYYVLGHRGLYMLFLGFPVVDRREPIMIGWVSRVLRMIGKGPFILLKVEDEFEVSADFEITFL